MERKKTDSSEKKPNVEKEKPNFGLSGKLTEETNTFKGIVIKYSEPPEARKPQKIRWRLYPFKGEEALPVMYIHRQSAYLLGRERKVADISIDHPSCSNQHAALQYRIMPYERKDGSQGRRIRPYIIDLHSSNGTFVNGTQIPASRYVELFEKDVLKFGFSTREYVILHEGSKDVEDEEEESLSPKPIKEQCASSSSLNNIKTEPRSPSSINIKTEPRSSSSPQRMKEEPKEETGPRKSGTEEHRHRKWESADKNHSKDRRSESRHKHEAKRVKKQRR